VGPDRFERGTADFTPYEDDVTPFEDQGAAELPIGVPGDVFPMDEAFDPFEVEGTSSGEAMEETPPPEETMMGGETHPPDRVAEDTHSEADERDPPRKAWPRIDAPEHVVEEQAFEVVIGLRPNPDPNIAGDPLTRPPGQRGPYDLEVHLVADGCRLAPDADGEASQRWRRTLRVTADAPYPTTTYRLIAEAANAPFRAEKLDVYFAVGHQTIGQAFRAFIVRKPAEDVSEAPQVPPPAGAHLSVPARPQPVDLEVRIAYAEQRHRLRWTFETPHAGIELPDEVPPTGIGTNAEAYAQDLIANIEAQKNPSGMRLELGGLGITIRDLMPGAFWRILTAVQERVATERPDDRPTLLLLTQEPFIPWELATCPPAALVDETSNGLAQLAMQYTVGRWVLGPMDALDAETYPPEAHAVSALAAVSGTYDHSRWEDLEEAKAETAALADAYGAVSVAADLPSVLRLCQEGDPHVDVMHFAVHGRYAPGQKGRGLVLVDDDDVFYLSDRMIRGFQLRTRPVVFLNACQVGSGAEELGTYAGMAAAFLRAGAAAVIAPLWAVNDRVARELALTFYDEIAGGTPASDALRDARRRVSESAAPDASASVLATPFAYQFFGHPRLSLDWNPN
jgi:hypothetical protein